MSPRFAPFTNHPLTPRDLRADEVEIWCVDLDPPSEITTRLSASLSSDERQRASRFVFERDRRRFSVGRGVLRALCGAYIGAPADAIRFRYAARGKPELAGGEIQFNVSHSEDLALMAFSRIGRLGVDVERLRHVPEVEHIAKSHFSPSEREVFAAVPARLKQEVFFNCWTRKEAFIKALGDGFYFSLENFDVTLAPGEPPRLLSILGNREHAAEWSLYPLQPASDYVGALAIKGRDWRLSAWSLAGDWCWAIS